MDSSISPLDALARIAAGASSIDVRAPIEFQKGSLPSATNTPILDDEQRAEVGVSYKSEGPKAATSLGHRLVSGELKDARVTAWLAQLERDPSALLYCARGGQRSQIAAQWIHDAGGSVQRIDGGFKAMRNQMLPLLAPDPSSIVILGGSTGVGKTVVIQSDENAIDLEGRANHRGSAFGAHLSGQPSQIDFENAVALEFFKQQRTDSHNCNRNPTLLEDEGRMIGRIHLPPPLQAAMQQAPLVILEAAPEARVSHIFEEYVVEHLDEIRGAGTPADPFHVLEERLGSSLLAIRKRLGGAGYTVISEQLRAAIKAHRDGDASGHQDWIKTLLLDYYDPMYAYQLEKKQHRVVFRGSAEEVMAWRSSKAVGVS
jgi:tRNA 2-selenouridine synthase